MPPTEELIKTFVTFVVMAHLLGTVPVFLAETSGMDAARRSQVCRKAAISGTVTLVLSSVLGEAMLAFFGVTTDSLRVAGGLVILLGALQMVKGGGHEAEAQEGRDPSVIPLAIPMFAGPGFIGAVIIASQKADGLGPSLVIIGMIAVVGVLWWLAMSSATWLGRKLGEGGLDVVTRISGLLLAALAMEMIAEGSKKLFGIGT